MKHSLKKQALCAIASLGLWATLLAQEPITLQPHDTITFCGDCGPFDKIVGSYLAACQPQQFSVQAIPGGRITDLAETPAGQAKEGPNVGDQVLSSAPSLTDSGRGHRSSE